MEPAAVLQAAKALHLARQTGIRLDRLPESARPHSAADAWAIQLATVKELGEAIAGWKVGLSPDHGVFVGILVGSRIFGNGASIAAAEMPMLGVEAEIAFRFDRALPPREHEYVREEIEDAVTAFPAIEIVDTRFRDYATTPVLERTADFMSNGGFVAGTPRDDWRTFDLARLEVSLTVDGVELVHRVGGNPAGDPLGPAIALVNVLRASTGIPQGTIATTGSYTGLERVKPGSRVEATFAGFGAATCGFHSDILR
jgi:2-keto-4-pentenoate hydratase